MPTVRRLIEFEIGPLAEGYLRVCEKAIQLKREFFGLRDFYRSLYPQFVFHVH